jgi:PadR family transcriptional regulator PadR
MPPVTLQTQAIMSALLENPSTPHYGLELARAAGLASGTIYPILARLERAGWVRSELEDIDPKVTGRRPRRYYMLTGEGEVVARPEISATHERPQPAPRRLESADAPAPRSV